MRLHRLPDFLGCQTLQAYPRAGVHVRRLTSTPTQEQKSGHQDSDDSSVGRKTTENKKGVGGGANMGEKKRKDSGQKRKGETPANTPPPKKVLCVHRLMDFAGLNGSLFLDLQA